MLPHEVSMPLRLSPSSVVLFFSLFFVLGFRCPASAAVLAVSTTEELIAALATAAENGENDTISVAEGLYSLSSTLTYNSVEDYSLTLQGAGDGAVFDGGNSNSRILFIRTYTSGGNVSLKNLTLQNGYSPEGESGAGMLANISSADLLLEEVVIKDCFGGAFYFSIDGGGAYITCGIGANLIMRNCIISGNSAKGYGGGLYLNLTNGRLDFINNTVINNHNRAGVVEQGGGIYLKFFYDTSEAYIHNNIFWNNTWAYGDGDLYIVNDRDDDGTGTPIQFTHNDIGYLDTLITDGLTTSDNLAEDPLLAVDFRLQHGSLCIDQGDSEPENLPTTDLAGNGRSLDGDCSDGEQPDLGAYEYNGFAEVTTTEPYAIISTGAQSGGEVLSEGGFFVTARGVCWAEESLPDLDDTCSEDGSGTGSFISTIDGLVDHTSYYLRAYATNCLGTVYGDALSFTTSVLPGVVTGTITTIRPPTAQSGGEVVSAGDSAVTARGVCWDQEPFPDLTTSCTTDGAGTGTFSSSLTSLTEGNTYFVRAYATNGDGTAYGQQISFVATWQNSTSWLLFLPAMLNHR